MLTAPFWVFEVGGGRKIREIDLLEKLFFGCVLVHGKEVRAEDEEETLPLLLTCLSVICSYWYL